MNINLAEVLQNEWQGAINIIKHLDIDLLKECETVERLILVVQSIEVFEDGFYLAPINMWFPTEQEAINEMEEQNDQTDDEDCKMDLSNIEPVPFYLETYNNSVIEQTDITLHDKIYFDSFLAWIKQLEEKNDLYKSLSKQLSKKTKAGKKSCKV